jgi:hypothetical protein
LYIWSLSDLKDKATVKVKHGDVDHILDMTRDEETGSGNQQCIGEDGGLDWIGGPITCSNRPLYSRIGILDDLIAAKTQEVTVIMPDYTLSVSCSTISRDTVLIARCNVTASEDQRVYWMVGFGFAREGSLKTRIVAVMRLMGLDICLSQLLSPVY